MSRPKQKARQMQTNDNSAFNQKQAAPAPVSTEAIRECAYQKWLDAGCPEGDGVNFWLQAEAELMAQASRIEATARPTYPTIPSARSQRAPTNPK